MNNLINFPRKKSTQERADAYRDAWLDAHPWIKFERRFHAWLTGIVITALVCASGSIIIADLMERWGK